MLELITGWDCQSAKTLLYTLYYILINSTIITTLWYRLFAGEYSMLLVSFHLQRHMGNFLIQVYGPCVLLVVLSWVSFWLNREATADRVSLGKLFKFNFKKINILYSITLRLSNFLRYVQRNVVERKQSTTSYNP